MAVYNQTPERDWQNSMEYRLVVWAVHRTPICVSSPALVEMKPPAWLCFGAMSRGMLNPLSLTNLVREPNVHPA